MFNRIVHASDGSPNAMAALHTALELARWSGGEVHVVFVEEIAPRSGMMADVAGAERQQQRQIAKWRASAEASARAATVNLRTHVFAGHPVQQVSTFVHEIDADLLVLGATAHRDLWESLSGRKADRMAHAVQCSVLLVREGGHDARKHA